MAAALNEAGYPYPAREEAVASGAGPAAAGEAVTRPAQHDYAF
jgi:hypothetical protein